MNKCFLIIITGLSAIAFESCDFEDRHVNVCDGHYGSAKVIDSLVRRYDFNNAVYFAQWYKDYAAPKHPNCDTIELVIQSDTIPFPYNDTFAVSVAKVFFNDSSNREVKCLKIKVIDYWPYIGKAEVNFEVSRDDLIKQYATNMLPEVVEMKYEIVQKGLYTFESATESGNGFKIVANLKEDYKGILRLATNLKMQYDSLIKADNCSEIQIDLIVTSPPGKLCTGKSYNIFYDKGNKNM